jgi:hypothetical protein
MKMTDDELISIIDRRIAMARDGGLQQGDRQQAMDYFLCRPRGDELPGRSVVQSADVADMIHATMAQVLPAFTGDSVCEFEPDAEGDESQARLESDAVNKVMMEASRGFVVFTEAIKDALQLRNGIIKVWAEEQEWTETEHYRGLTGDQQASLGAEQADGEDRYSVIKTGTRQRIRMAAIDPINFYVDDEADCILIDDVRGVYERKVYARGDLVAMDLDREQIESLPTYMGGSGVADQARRAQSVRMAPTPSGWAAELVEVWESHVRLDVNGDGELELLRTLSGVGVLLLKEPAEWICYATGTAWIQPHRWQGLSMHDLLKGVQDVKTAALRGYIDNMSVATNQRLAVNSETVNIDDAKTSRPGGLIRVRGLPAENLMLIPSNDVGPSAQSLLTYMDKIRSERGGAALEMQAGQPGLMSSQIGTQNVADVLTNIELLGNMVAKTLAETLVRSAFLLVHRLLRTTVLEPMTLRLADRWVMVDPGTWKARDRINIKAGLSPGERRKKAATLEAVVQHQLAMMSAGLDGILVGMPNIYAAQRDWCAAQGLDAGERYFTDPTGQAAQQASQQKLQQAQQQQQMQQQMQQMQAQLAQQQLQTEQAKVHLDKYKADLDNKFNYWKEALNAEIEEAKIIGSATADLQLAELQGRQQAAAGSAESGSGEAGPGGGGA